MCPVAAIAFVRRARNSSTLAFRRCFRSSESFIWLRAFAGSRVSAREAELTALLVFEEELAKRRETWVCPEPKVKTGYLARYAKLVSSADKGAILL